MTCRCRSQGLRSCDLRPAGGRLDLRSLEGDRVPGRDQGVSGRHRRGRRARPRRSRTGKITVFVGPSGCGKTTSLRMINRMIDPTGGTILLDGKDIRESDPPLLRRGIGYVIQHAGLFPHRTVLDNIATVPLLHRLRASARRAPGRPELLELVGLDGGVRQALPGPALRRPAAARRRRPGARRRPAGAADGRAVQRGRPDRARRPAAGAAAPAVRTGQDDRVRHPRHRRGDQARRQGRGVPGRRPARAVRHAVGAARQAGRRLRVLVRRPRPRLPRARLPHRERGAGRSARHGQVGEPAGAVDGGWARGRGRRRTSRSAGSAADLSTEDGAVWPDDLVSGGSLFEVDSTAAARPARCATRWTPRSARRPRSASRSTSDGAVVGGVTADTVLRRARRRAALAARCPA